MKIRGKNIMKRILILGILGAFFLGSEVSAQAATPKVSRIRWSNVRTKRTMYAKTSKRFTVKITPSRAKTRKLQWYSSNKKVATVSSKGTVKALRSGTAYITCRVRSQKYRKVVSKVTVKKKKVTKVDFSSSIPVIQKGKTYTRRPTVSPSYAYDRRVSYRSSNTGIATVSSSGVVTGKAEGYATITATARDGSKKRDSYKIRVIGNITADSAKFVAHRGLSSAAPENTVKAYELAGEAGFWGAEADVRKTKDGKFILMHDATLSRMCGVNARPEDLTYDEIRSSKIISGNNYAKYKSTSTAVTVASLDEYLNTCVKYDMVPVIEIKMEYDADGNARSIGSMQTAQEKDLRQLYSETEEIMQGKPYKIIAFDLDTVLELRRVLTNGYRKTMPSNVSLQHVTSSPDLGMINFYKKRGIELDTNYTKVNTASITQFRDGGVPVNAWTIDDQGKVWDFMKAKVDYITTNKRFW